MWRRRGLDRQALAVAGLERYVLPPPATMKQETSIAIDQEPVESSSAQSALFDGRDRDRLRYCASFVLGSLRRHKFLFVSVFTAILGGTVGSFFLLPKTYHVETKAFAEPTSALTVRGDGPGAESLTHAAADTVLRQENLLALIQETDLLQYMNDHRAPAQRVRDVVVTAVRGQELSHDDQVDALLRRLEKKLVVWTNDSANGSRESTVTIAIDWPDGPMACRLVDASQRAFLDARYAREVTALSESIEIHQRHIASLKADIDAAVEGIEKMHGTAAPGSRSNTAAPSEARPAPRATAAPHPSATASPRPDGDLQRLSQEIQLKQRSIEELEEGRRRRLSELQAKLAEARTTFTESHPTIVDLKQLIGPLSVESAQVTNLRREIAALRADYDARRAAEPTASAGSWVPPSSAEGSASTPPQLSSDVLRLALDLREDRDPAMIYARGELRDAMDKYAALRAQIQAAQIDLETAQAAFKYRYMVVTPARLPREPTVPNVPVVTLVAFVVAVLSGLVFVVLEDVRRGRLLERWQIERLLERPVLGEIVLPEELETA
jgi:hypothetical protein